MDYFQSKPTTVTIAMKNQPIKPFKFSSRSNCAYFMVILLLANDTELNPGPRPVKYPCIVCSKPAKWGQTCLQCDSCDGWYHTQCMDMPIELYETYANSNISWICSQCGQPNVSPPALNPTSGLPLSNSFSFLDVPHQPAEDQQPLASDVEPTPQESSNKSANSHKSKSNLKFLVVNCDGLYNKFPDLLASIDTEKPDVIVGTESHLKSSILSPEITPPGYNIFRRDRASGRKGGIFIMTKDTLITTECTITAPNAELVWIELHVQGHKPLIIGSFYRPPNSPDSNLQELNTSLSEIGTRCKNAVIILCGDFNLDGVDWVNRTVKPYAKEATKCSKLLDICNDNFLDQMVIKPTRISGATKSILDLVLTSHPGFITNSIVMSSQE